ncbi:hypothetical protein LOTGIDRAFT_167393 [Lottia gigantea]|uniref:MARVEL domain-containing protein n=1 Tax=Lottia gigantea TaxID=225164 RepID=V3ZUA0_LOTGI|nr:hypothetical protein LOTGIDRAFT_167393 [Lottia gigantea]ESO86160.1 hypothetical protein LOTGIDRAFT_167393 [Lottia gigantea]
MAALLEYVKQFLLQRAFMYGLILLASFFVISPLGSLQTTFNERCILYADFKYTTVNKTHYFAVNFGESSVCDYDLAVSVIFCMCYPVIGIATYIFLYFREKADKKVDLSHLLFMGNCIVDIIITVLVLVVACTISTGFTHLCNQIMSGTEQGIRLTGCSDAQKFESWRMYHDSTYTVYDGTKFHVDLSIATAGSWFAFIFWFLQALFGTWKLWRLNMLPTCPDKFKILCCKDS